MGALALTYKEQYKTPFAPVMPGAKQATYQDLESAAKVIKKVSLYQIDSTSCFLTMIAVCHHLSAVLDLSLFWACVYVMFAC